MADRNPTPGGAAPWFFLGAVYLGLEAYLWLVVPTRNSLLIAIGAIVVLFVLVGDPIRRGETADSVGLDVTHLRQATLRLLPMTALAMIVLFAVNQLVAAPPPDLPRFGRRFLAILPWAFLQQGMLQATFNRRITARLGPGWRAAGLVALAFAGMHLPGPLLVAITGLAGLVWARTYQSAPNLWVLVLSHALLSAMAQSSLPREWTHGFRVGPGWFRWHP
ncbi:MAG TPA: CPBP family intramembrane glutamic endopeptidase [Candidatus Eisenbacteria bacterium]